MRLSLPFEPVELIPGTELTALADSVPAVARLRAFVGWLGPGRALTTRGNLRLADARELVALLGTGDVIDPVVDGRVVRTRSAGQLRGLAGCIRLARSAGFVRTITGKLVPVRKLMPLLDDPLRAWRRLFDALGGLEQAVCEAAPRPSALRWSFPEVVETVLALLYSVDAFMGVDDLVRAVRALVFSDDEPDRPPLAWAHPAAGSRPLAVVPAPEPGDVGRWRRLLAVEMDRLLEQAESAGVLVRTGQRVRLTPLGVWATRGRLAALGYHVPIQGDFADSPARTVVAVAAGYDERHADIELERWCAARAPGEAARQLAAVARGTSDQAGCVVALRALVRLGGVGVDTVAALRGDSAVGRYAAVMLFTEGIIGPDEITADERRFLRVETLLATAREEGPDALLVELAELGPLNNVVAFLADVRRSGHPALPHLLDLVASCHPEPAVARAARKTRFQLATPH